MLLLLGRELRSRRLLLLTACRRGGPEVPICLCNLLQLRLLRGQVVLHVELEHL